METMGQGSLGFMEATGWGLMGTRCPEVASQWGHSVGRSSLMLCERGLFFGPSSSLSLYQLWGKKLSRLGGCEVKMGGGASRRAP